MEYSAPVRCGAPSCPNPPIWRFASAHRWESPATALEVRAQYRCGEHLDLAGLVWLPDLAHGMVVVVDPAGVSPAEFDHERTDTSRIGRHLIDVAQLRPGRPDVPPSVTGDATQLVDLDELERRLRAALGTDR